MNELINQLIAMEPTATDKGVAITLTLNRNSIPR